MEREASSTYVDVHLLPLNIQSHTFEPFDTTINVTFRYVKKKEFLLTFRGITPRKIAFECAARFQKALPYLRPNLRFSCHIYGLTKNSIPRLRLDP